MKKGKMESVPLDPLQVDVKCEVIDVSDEEVTLDGGEPDTAKPPDEDKQPNPQEKKRIRKNKKKDPSQYVQCDRCSKKFATNAQLKKHIWTHTGEKPYICAECGKSYRQSHHLKTHELSHNPIGLTKSFTCTECGSSFTRKSSLRTHERIHTGVKPYACKICPKAFVQKNNLIYHVKIHQDDRQFHCDVCFKKFMTRSKLRQHSVRHLKKGLKLDKPVVGSDNERSENSVHSENSDSEERITVTNSPLWGGSETEDG